MRIFPIITAILVSAVLYAVTIERDRLVQFAQRFSSSEAVAGSQNPVEPVVEVQNQADPDARVVHIVARRSLAQIVDNAVQLRGRTEAIRQVNVQSETDGLIISEPLRAGSVIAAGQLLCEIDPGTRNAALAEAEAALGEARTRVPEAQSRVAEARALLAEAVINDNAASRLNETGFASETRVAATAAAVSTAQASLESATAGVEGAHSGIQAAEATVFRANEEIARLQIRAPFNGLLEIDTAELGALMQTGSLCGTVIQLNQIKLVGFVPEIQVDKIEIGAPAGARLATGREVQGVVTFLSRSADPQTRTFRVEVTVENQDLTIRDGQTADILISSDGILAHILPSSAMTLNDDGDLGLRVVDADQIARFAPVTLLRDTATGVVLAGLPQEVDVITVGQEFVSDGVRVDVTYEELTQ
jgi:multidrug efflux system membrane fusion protein